MTPMCAEDNRPVTRWPTVGLEDGNCLHVSSGRSLHQTLKWGLDGLLEDLGGGTHRGPGSPCQSHDLPEPLGCPLVVCSQ